MLTPTGRIRTPTPLTAEGPRPSPSALARCVGDVERFFAEVAGVAPHRHTGSSLYDLLSLADVDGALTTRGLRHPAVRVVRDGDVLPRASWTRRARTGSVWIDDLVDPSKVLGHFADGATIVLQSLHRWWPPLGDFCRSLEVDLGHAVQANAYLTPAGAAGLTPHHDTHDVFVLQVHGTKQWVVREPVLDTPLPLQRSHHELAARQPVLFEAEVAPGECLYLPRGFVHSARAQAGVSLHITIGVLATTAHDVLRRVLDAAAESDVTFRRTLPPLGAPPLDIDGAKVLLTDLLSWLEAADPADIAALAPRGPAPRSLEGHLLDLAELNDLADDSVVVARSMTGPAVTRSSDRVVVSLPDRRIDVPAAVEAPVRMLVDGTPHAVRDLAPFLDERSRLVLVRRFVREGVLRLSRD